MADARRRAGVNIQREVGEGDVDGGFVAGQQVPEAVDIVTHVG